MPRLRLFLLAAAASVTFTAAEAAAQPVCPGNCASPVVRWHVQAEGRMPIPGVQTYPLDSLSVVAHRLLGQFQRDGYFSAAIQKIDTTVAGRGVRITFHVERGARGIVENVVISGIESTDSAAVADMMDTVPGRVVRGGVLEADIERILRHFESSGYPLAEVEVRDISVEAGSGPVGVQLHVEKGPAVVIDDIQLSGASRVRRAFVRRVLGLSSERKITSYDPAAVRRRLQATGLFTAVGEPRLEVNGTRRAVLEIPVEEAPPGHFDLVLGYKPPAGGAGGQLVGNGFIDLQNLFGAGRRLHFEMDRMSGQVSEVEAGVDAPFTAGLPLRTAVRFAGYQQDSTYGTRSLAGNIGYRMDGGLEVSLSGEWHTARPGINGSEQSIPPSTTWSGGLGVRYRELDHHTNPRKGWLFELSLHHGRKQRRDTAAVLRQQRLESRMRTFVPTFQRQLLAAGYDAWFLQSPTYDETDLYRIGGTRTLRGYEEDRFLARLATRGLLEYRLQIDRQSYGFLFADVGYIGRPDYGSVERSRWWRWGYGAGAQVQTNAGLVKLSYALTPQAGAAGGRVHIGMSLEL